MQHTIVTNNAYQVARALRARILTLDVPQKPRLLYYLGKAWRVLEVVHLGKFTHIRLARAARRSIDDCSVAEWKRATAQAVPRSWHQWLGGARPVGSDTRVDVIYRGSDAVDRNQPAGALRWDHQGTKSDIHWWRTATALK